MKLKQQQLETRTPNTRLVFNLIFNFEEKLK